MNLVFSDATDATVDPITIAVAVPPDDQLGGVVAQVLGSLSEGGGLEVGIREATPDDVRSLVGDGVAGMGVVVPADFTAALMAGDGPQVEVTLRDNAGITGQIVNSIIQGTLTELTSATR